MTGATAASDVLRDLVLQLADDASWQHEVVEAVRARVVRPGGRNREGVNQRTTAGHSRQFRPNLDPLSRLMDEIRTE